MPRAKSWKDDDLRKAVAESENIKEVIEKLGLGLFGGNYRVVHRYIKKLELDTSHMIGSSHKGKIMKSARKLKDILVRDSDYSSTYHLKNRLIKEGLFDNKCTECGLDGEWHQKKLNMILDHINGISNDNRLSNLRMLCPNCNSQQVTFAGRNKGINKFEN